MSLSAPLLMDSMKKLFDTCSPGLNENNQAGFLDDLFPISDFSTFSQTRLFGPFTYHKLKNLPNNGGVPDEILVSLKQGYYWTAVSNLKKLSEATKVLQALQQADILAVPLKGISLIETVYHDLGVRLMADIDLLVKPEDIHEIKKILDETDYQFIDAYRGSYNFEDGKNRVFLDVHTKFTRYEELFSIDYEEIYRLLRRVDFNGQIHVQVLCPEHQMIHIALHLAPGLYSQFNILNLLDLYHLLGDQKHPIAWEYVVDFSQRSEISSYIYAPLLLCSHLFPAKVPQWVLRVLGDRLSRRKTNYIQNNYVKRILNGDGANAKIFFNRLMWAERFSKKLRLLRMALFPDRQEIAHRYSTSESSSKIYGIYVMRLWKLTRGILKR
jgi:hypothetical protein